MVLRPQGAINIAEYVHSNLLSVGEVEPLPAGGQSPIDQLVNLRLQAESAARSDRLYQRRSPHWQGLSLEKKAQGAGYVTHSLQHAMHCGADRE
jgi:hypothetical protein